MRWAFWRRAADRPARPLPSGTGLPPSDRPPASGRQDDADDEPGSVRRAGAGSGATPDAGRHGPPRRLPPPPVDGHPPAVDEAQLAGSGPVVTALVRAVLADEPDDVRAAVAGLADLAHTRAAAAAAAGVLAGRLPALSGVAGPVAFDEVEGDLLHAYADLLAERAEQRRARVAPAVSREQLMVVAHLSAAAAVGDAAGEPTLLVLAGMPAQEQLLAGGVLLAQTCVDGGGEPEDLPREVTDLFG